MATTVSNLGPAATRTPWHLWAIGAVGVLWNAFGAYDYLMSKTRGDPYLQSAGMTPDQIARFHAMPVWMTAVWAVGVWGALLGTALLLARSRYALPVFVASLVAYVMSLVYDHVLAPMPPGESAPLVMQGVILAGCVFFVWYAARARQRGWLR